MRRIRFKISATGCRVVQRELVDQPPESPVIGLIVNPVAGLPNVGTAGKSNEPNPEAPDHTPAAAEGASNAGGTGSSGAEGSRGPAVRLVPFQSMPQSTQ